MRPPLHDRCCASRECLVPWSRYYSLLMITTLQSCVSGARRGILAAHPHPDVTHLFLPVISITSRGAEGGEGDFGEGCLLGKQVDGDEARACKWAGKRAQPKMCSVRARFGKPPCSVRGSPLNTRARSPFTAAAGPPEGRERAGGGGGRCRTHSHCRERLMHRCCFQPIDYARLALSTTPSMRVSLKRP